MTLPCFYKYECSYSPHTQHAPSLVCSTFCKYSSQTPSKLVPEDLRNPQSPKHVPRCKNTSAHLHLEILLLVWVLGKYRSRFSLYWRFSRLFMLEKELYAWLVGFRTLCFESRTPSHLVHIRCLFFCLSEFLVTLLGNSIEW